MQTAAPDTLVGRSLEGRYRILERIARGGMSTVYAAVDERLDRLVAVKVMSAALSADPAFSDRFAREARAAARLTHLNVVSVYDQGAEVAPDGHHVFLVMELVEGRTLRELLRERGRLTPAEAISIMGPVLSALSAAHRAGLAHRDVKPENILLSDDGIVKVADFGLARAVESDPTATRTGLMMGTVAYCAPEQISKGSTDPRSDVYSAGIVLFELLTGTPPYKGDSAMNVAWQHVHSRVPAPSSRVKGIPSEIDELVINATDSDPDSRPSDAGAFLAEVADVRSELGLPVVPVPARDRSRSRRLRADVRQRTPDAETTDLLRGGAQTHDTTVVPRRGAPPAAPPPPVYAAPAGPPPPVVIPPQQAKAARRSRRRRRALIALIVVLLLGAAAAWGGKLLADHYLKYVPNVVKKSESAAVQRLEHAGYHVKIYSTFNETIAKGLVISTDPGAGERLADGGNVTVTVSTGPQMFTVPRVRNDSYDGAVTALRQAGAKNVVSTPRQTYDDTVPKGDVVGTDPAAGQVIRRKDPVTLLVSQGPRSYPVPAVAPGTPYDEARRTLKNSPGQFKPKRVFEYSDTVGKDEVISVDPSDQAVKGSTITVTVSKGPEFVTVPDIPLGTSKADADSQLRQLGLVPDFKQEIGDRTDPVVYSVPSAGEKVHVGTTVTVIVI